MRVVVASSDEESAGWLRGVLSSAGLTVAVISRPAPDSPELAGADLLVADAEAAAAIGAAGPPRRVLLVGRGHAVDMSQAMGGGFLDVLIVPAPEDDVLARVGRALDRFLRPARATESGRATSDELRVIVDRVVESLRHADSSRTQATHELAEGMLSVFLLMIDSHETTDRGTPGHSKRMANLVRAMALGVGRSEQEASWLELAGRLHDIGLVPLAVPLKGTEPLSLELRRALTPHPRMGAEILEPLARWGLPVDAVSGHHERIDGSGYPQGLEGDEVPVDAQILGAADAFEALTSPRPWRPAEQPDAALSALRKAKGFRPEVLDVLESAMGTAPPPPGGLPHIPSDAE